MKSLTLPLLLSVFALALSLAATGCASIVLGPTQQVSVISDPAGAEVTVDGNFLGVTPLVLQLERRDSHIVTISLPGFKPQQVAMSRRMSNWVFGNLVFGGVPGFIVDASTGAMYELTPSQVSAKLRPEGGAFAGAPGELIVAVVLEADPSWIPMGQLEPLP